MVLYYWCLLVDNWYAYILYPIEELWFLFFFLPPRGKCIPVIASIFAIVRISFYFAFIGLYELIPRAGIVFTAKCSAERCFGPL
jgi:hypothetical protein